MPVRPRSGRILLVRPADRRRTIRPGPGDGRIPPLSGDGRPVPGAPEGYETFYISHYGRHGSRYLLYDSQYAFVRDVLSRAAADGKLTPSGQKALADFLEAYPQFEGRAGMLTRIGAASTGRSPGGWLNGTRPHSPRKPP